MIRSVAEFLDEAKGYAPRQVERDLIAACQEGEPLNLGPLPPYGPPDPAKLIRADLLRLIITGGTPECGLHPIGIILRGAFIMRTLNLDRTLCRGRVALMDCRFTEAPDLVEAQLAHLNLDGSLLPGLVAQGIRIAGNLFLRNLISQGTVNLSGATIDGQLEFDGATLDGAGAAALHAQGMSVTSIFMFREVKSVKGRVYLDAAHVRDLADDPASWPRLRASFTSTALPMTASATALKPLPSARTGWRAGRGMAAASTPNPTPNSPASCTRRGMRERRAKYCTNGRKS